MAMDDIFTGGPTAGNKLRHAFRSLLKQSVVRNFGEKHNIVLQSVFEVVANFHPT